MTSSPVVCVFGSGCVEETDPGYRQAKELGGLLAKQGYCVCTGGYAGIMEAAARGAKDAGGKTLGITVAGSKRCMNPWMDQEIKMPTWQERLFRLIEVADGYAVFDGGTGTLTELLTVWEMTNKHMMKKPVAILGPFNCALMDFFKSQPFMIFNEWLRLTETPETAAAYFAEKLRIGNETV